MTTDGAGRQLDVHLHLLDRQVVDPDGHFVCKVDDLDLQIGEDGHPYVTAISVGPRAVGPRIGGRLGHWFVAIAERLADTEKPPHIDFGYVTDIGHDIRVSKTRHDLEVDPFEHWVHDNVISRIPGSGHESE
jgi:sporulation protein YlmC with PRC-barrel domain